MGHVWLGRLPATRKWQQVVSLLSEGATLERIAGASAEAAENSLGHARRDPALLHSFWLLTQIPLAARAPSVFSSSRRPHRPPRLTTLTSPARMMQFSKPIKYRCSQVVLILSLAQSINSSTPRRGCCW